MDIKLEVKDESCFPDFCSQSYRHTFSKAALKEVKNETVTNGIDCGLDTRNEIQDSGVFSNFCLQNKREFLSEDSVVGFDKSSKDSEDKTKVEIKEEQVLLHKCSSDTLCIYDHVKMDEGALAGGNSKASQKKQKQKKNRQLHSEERNHDKDPDLLDFIAPCEHKEGRFHCGSIPTHYLTKVKQEVFSCRSKCEQDHHLSLMIQVSSPKRRRPRGEGRRTATSMTVKYQIPVNDETEPVCSKFFGKLFGCGQSRLNTIAKSIKSGEGCKERRGGDRKSDQYRVRREKVISFISSLKANESNFNRKKNQHVYLPSELSISKLFKMYNENMPEELKVRKWFFNKNFNAEFNLSFGTPATTLQLLSANETY